MTSTDTGSAPRVFGGDLSGKRSWTRALMRGLRKKCPRCGRGRLFDGYVRTQTDCETCGLRIAGHQADDAPPYITIMVIGHIAIPLALAAKQLYDPPLTLQFAVLIPLVLLATAWLLPVVKGGLVALQWAHRMHGFAEPPGEPLAP